MKIQRVEDHGLKTLTYLLQETNGWDRTFEYEGRQYVVIAKGDSQNTAFQCVSGFIPVFNLKSRTVRAIPDDTLVKPTDCTVQVDEFYDV